MWLQILANKITCLLFPITTCFYIFCMCLCVFVLSLCLEKRRCFSPEDWLLTASWCHLNSLKTYVTSRTSFHHFKIVQQKIYLLSNKELLRKMVYAIQHSILLILRQRDRVMQICRNKEGAKRGYWGNMLIYAGFIHNKPR